MTTIRLRLLSQRKNVSSDYSVLKARPSKKYWTAAQECAILIQSDRSVSMTVRSHLFPFRTQKLSSLVPKIVSWKRLVKIGSRRLEWKVLRDFSQGFFVAQKYGVDFGQNDNRTGLDKNTTTQYNIDKLLRIT